MCKLTQIRFFKLLLFADGQGLIDVIQPNTDLTNVIKGAKVVILKVADASQIRKKVNRAQNVDLLSGLTVDSTETPEVIDEPITETLAAERSQVLTDEICASAASMSIASGSNTRANSMQSPSNGSSPVSPSNSYTPTSPVPETSTDFQSFLDTTRSPVEQNLVLNQFAT